MNTGKLFRALALFALASLAGCGGGETTGGGGASQPGTAAAPSGPVLRTAPLPDAAYRAQITVADPPTRLRAGQKVIVNVKTKNASDVVWADRSPEVETPKFVVAVMNNWLKPDGELVTNMDGRHGIGGELKPGGEVEVPLVVTAPKQPGDYILELDLVEEGVTFFKDKGSETLKLKVKVE